MKLGRPFKFHGATPRKFEIRIRNKSYRFLRRCTDFSKRFPPLLSSYLIEFLYRNGRWRRDSAAKFSKKNFFCFYFIIFTLLFGLEAISGSQGTIEKWLWRREVGKKSSLSSGIELVLICLVNKVQISASKLSSLISVEVRYYRIS